METNQKVTSVKILLLVGLVGFILSGMDLFAPFTHEIWHAIPAWLNGHSVEFHWNWIESKNHSLAGYILAWPMEVITLAAMFIVAAWKRKLKCAAFMVGYTALRAVPIIFHGPVGRDFGMAMGLYPQYDGLINLLSNLTMVVLFFWIVFSATWVLALRADMAQEQRKALQRGYVIV